MWRAKDNKNRQRWHDYLNELSPYFEDCKNSDVLEIGAGTHTNLILSKTPSSLTLLEPDILGYRKLVALYSEVCTIVEEDVFFYLNEPRKFDVVICCGVIYHFHHPLWLLELIVNRINPKVLIIETFGYHELKFRNESDNQLGHRQLKNNWKSCKMALIMHSDNLVKAMDNLGYDTVVNIQLTKPSTIHELPADLLKFVRR